MPHVWCVVCVVNICDMRCTTTARDDAPRAELDCRSEKSAGAQVLRYVSAVSLAYYRVWMGYGMHTGTEYDVLDTFRNMVWFCVVRRKINTSLVSSL